MQSDDMPDEGQQPQVVDNFEYWPEPLSKEEEELRRRAGRLLESLRRIPILYSDPKAWENDREFVFSLLRRGCIDGMVTGMLEAPIYDNRQIESAWLFLIQMRQRHPNRRKQIVECTTSLGASYNWSLVLYGSRKVRAALQSAEDHLRREILEAANATEMLAEMAPATPAGNGIPAGNGATASLLVGHDQGSRNIGHQEPTELIGAAAWAQGGTPLRAPGTPPRAPGTPTRATATPLRASGAYPVAGVEWASTANARPQSQGKKSMTGSASLNPFAPADEKPPGPPSPGAQLLLAALSPIPAYADDVHRLVQYAPGAATPPARVASSPAGASRSQTPTATNNPYMFNGPPPPNPCNPFGPPPSGGAASSTATQRPQGRRLAPSTPATDARGRAGQAAPAVPIASGMEGRARAGGSGTFPAGLGYHQMAGQAGIRPASRPSSRPSSPHDHPNRPRQLQY